MFVTFLAARAQVQHRAAVEHHAERGARQQLEALGEDGGPVEVGPQQQQYRNCLMCLVLVSVLTPAAARWPPTPCRSLPPTARERG